MKAILSLAPQSKMDRQLIGVTGGTGFVGKRVVALLASEGRVRVLARRNIVELDANVEHVTGDVTSDESASRFASGCTTVLHMAGIAHSELKTTEAKQHAYRVNVEGTRIVLNAALRHGVRRFVFVSSAHVYRGQAGLNLDESAPTDASTFYAETKLRAEELVQQAGRNGLQVVVARPCLIYGPHARFNLERIMRGIDRGYYFHISGINPIRSFLSVEDAALSLQHLLADCVYPGTYNLADENPWSLADFANELADRMGRPRPRTLPSGVVRVAGTIASLMKKYGIAVPALGQSIAKLTSNFSLSTQRLAGTGYRWKGDSGACLQGMVNDYLLQSHN